MTTRRSFLKHSLGVAGLYLAGTSCTTRTTALAGNGQPAAASLLVNHVGYAPSAGKFCLRPGNAAVEFSVVRISSGQVVHQGTMNPVRGDFGDFLVGDFSEFTHSGAFEFRSPGIGAAAFSIDPDIYTPAIKNCIDYFGKQRCGDSKTGYHAPCHLDDGRRLDNQTHQDVSGGWHDACDLRKWLDATIYGMTGLSRVLDVLGPDRIGRARVIEELRWGNAYFRKMQEPDGYLMNYCGGDDGNNWTDNKIGTADDRPIHTEPCGLPAQFHFIAAQAAMIRHTRDADPDYAKGCEAAALRCLDWVTTSRSPGAATSLAAGIIACVELHRATHSDRAKDQAAAFAKKLLTLQMTGVSGDAAPLNGVFLTAPDRLEPSREIQHGNLPLLALCELLEEFSDHPDAAAWRKALDAHIEYLLRMTQRSAFGTVPFGIYLERDPGGNRRIGRYWYRWFMKTDGEAGAADDWWVGINAHLASHGVGLIKASRLTKRADLAHHAQRQLDWIVGANPFNASTISGVGRNQPRLYVTGQFKPTTPLISGGVMNGIGGNARDEVAIDSGSWNTCEYWTPMVAYTMWIMAEVEKP